MAPIMKPEEFEGKMDELKKPHTDMVKPPVEMKLAILNAQRSAVLGFWFIVLPYVFLACMIMKFELNINFGVLNAFSDIVGTIDGNPLLWWIQPVVLIGLPVAGIILNALAITHFKWEATTRTLVFTLKLRWINLIVAAISLIGILMFAFYLTVENFQMRPGP